MITYACCLCAVVSLVEIYRNATCTPGETCGYVSKDFTLTFSFQTALTTSVNEQNDRQKIRKSYSNTCCEFAI